MNNTEINYTFTNNLYNNHAQTMVDFEKDQLIGYNKNTHKIHIYTKLEAFVEWIFSCFTGITFKKEIVVKALDKFILSDQYMNNVLKQNYSDLDTKIQDLIEKFDDAINSNNA